MVSIISLGGSIVAPDGVDTEFVSRFIRLIQTYTGEAGGEERKVILIVGGGGPARKYQQAYRNIVDNPIHDDQDWIGIMATRLNAELIRAGFAGLCLNPVVTDPSAEFEFTGSVLVAAGWKPGFSTDFDAVMLAERFNARRIINLSNIEQVYTADPKLDPNARPLDQVSWSEFREMVGDEWTPGKNLPFDPVATRKAADMGMEVIAAGGRDLSNIQAVLEGREFFGTRIGPG
ncbi:UMP kinase [Salinispira pacifica]|nr:UMP kinase [Salinispira pacifica]